MIRFTRTVFILILLLAPITAHAQVVANPTTLAQFCVDRTVTPWVIGHARKDGKCVAEMTQDPTTGSVVMTSPVNIPDNNAAMFAVSPVGNSDNPTFAASNLLGTVSRGTNAKEWFSVLGMNTSQGLRFDGSDASDKVLQYRGVQAFAGAGNTWVDNDVLDFNYVDPTARIIGYELDYNNASQNRPAIPTNSLASAFGSLITNTGFFTSGAAYVVEGQLVNGAGATNTGKPAWDAGFASVSGLGVNNLLLDAGNSRATVAAVAGSHTLGVDFGSVAFGQAAVRLRGGSNGPSAYGATAGSSGIGAGLIQWVSPTDGTTQVAGIGADGTGLLHISGANISLDANVLPGNGGIQLGAGASPFYFGFFANANVSGNVDMGSAGGTTVVRNTIVETASYTPPTSSSACTTGQKTWDTGYEYRCVATNTWKRASIGAF